MRRLIITEDALNKILLKIIKEGTGKAPVFGNGRFRDDYSRVFTQLSKIENLHTDRYKDYNLEKSWNDWKNTGYNKTSQEYIIYISNFKKFMFGEGGFLRHLSYVADRLNGPLHSVLLDVKWADSLVNKKDWSFSNEETGFGSEEFQCFYTTVLKLFQNPAIWNDFFFNPFFAEYKSKYDLIRKKITDLMKSDRENYENNYKPLLPIEEYKQLNLFMNEINADTKKIEKGLNNKPELYYNPSSEDEEDDEEDDY